MKKLNFLVLWLAVGMIFTASSDAQLRKDIASVKGTVVSVNAARTEIVVKDMVNGRDVRFSHPGIPVEVSAGKPVVVLYKAGTMNATTIRIVPVKRAADVAASANQATKVQPAKPAAAESKATPATKAAPEKPTKYGW